jgi:hypothetical protein
MNAVKLNFIAGPRNALNSWRMQASYAIKLPSSGTPKREILDIQGNSGGKMSILEGHSIGHIVGKKIRMTVCLILKGYRLRDV